MKSSLLNGWLPQVSEGSCHIDLMTTKTPHTSHIYLPDSHLTCILQVSLLPNTTAAYTTTLATRQMSTAVTFVYLCRSCGRGGVGWEYVGAAESKHFLPASTAGDSTWTRTPVGHDCLSGPGEFPSQAPDRGVRIGSSIDRSWGSS